MLILRNYSFSAQQCQPRILYSPSIFITEERQVATTFLWACSRWKLLLLMLFSHNRHIFSTDYSRLGRVPYRSPTEGPLGGLLEQHFSRPLAFPATQPAVSKHSITTAYYMCICVCFELYCDGQYSTSSRVADASTFLSLETILEVRHSSLHSFNGSIPGQSDIGEWCHLHFQIYKCGALFYTNFGTLDLSSFLQSLSAV